MLLLVEWLDTFGEVARLERVELVRWRQLTIHQHKWPIKVRGAVHLQLVGEGIAGEAIAIALKEQDMKADFIALWMCYFRVACLYRDLFAKDAEEGLLALLNEGTIDGPPETILILEYVLQTRILLLITLTDILLLYGTGSIYLHRRVVR